MRRTLRGWTVAALVLTACRVEEGPPGDRVLRTDSAGVEVVTSRSPAWGAEEGWRLSADPVVDLGGADGPPEELFQALVDVELGADGAVWVADAGDGTVRIFDGDGAHVATVGGRGDGPGEFQALGGLDPTPGGMLAHQRPPYPYSLFSPSGERVRTDRVQVHGTGGSPDWAGVVRGVDDPLAVVWDYPQGLPAQVGLYEQDARVYLSPLDGGEPVDLGWFTAARYFGVAESRGPEWQQYGPGLWVAACGDEVVLGWPEDYELRRYDLRGRPIRVVRRSWTPRPVTEEDREAYRERTLRRAADPRAPPSARRRAEAMARGMDFPENHPAYDRFFCDDRGFLWVEGVDPDLATSDGGYPPVPLGPATWDVFDPEGVWLGPVELPARFVPTSVRRDRIAGIHVSGLDVAHVRVHSLDGR